jgi:hypothetical protein
MDSQKRGIMVFKHALLLPDQFDMVVLKMNDWYISLARPTYPMLNRRLPQVQPPRRLIYEIKSIDKATDYLFLKSSTELSTPSENVAP